MVLERDSYNLQCRIFGNRLDSSESFCEGTSYHTYISDWEQILREDLIKSSRTWELDKSVVTIQKGNRVVEHFSKVKYGPFFKIIFYLLRSN